MEQIFDELLAAKAIKLPEPKRPSEVDKNDDPNYCRYHRIISHSLKDCYVLKNIVKGMIKRKEIEVDSSCPKATSNTVSLVEDDRLPVNTLRREPIPVAFEIDDEIKVVNIYPETLTPSNANMPTLYELMNEPSIEM